MEATFQWLVPRKSPCPTVPKRGMVGHTCTYIFKCMPLIDGKAGLDLQCHYRGALPGKPPY